MSNGISLPEGLIAKAARQLLEAGDLSTRIREVDGPPREDTSRVDVFVMVWQIGERKWKCTTIEPMTMHGQVTAYGWSFESATGCELKMALIRALIQAAVFNEYEPAKRYVLDRCSIRVADVQRLPVSWQRRVQ